jgi:sirohydrochlorin ferrochelatase
VRDILLIDNGSRKADATLSLRRIAARLGDHLGEPVYPVSLLHSDEVPASALNGRPADVFEPFMRRRLDDDARTFLILPLFFGPSRAIGVFIPDRVAALRNDFGPFAVRVADPLCPLPRGEPDLVRILSEHTQQTCAAHGISPSRVLLVDHGSPIRAVTEVRRWLAERLAERLGPNVKLGEAVMERRSGKEYDFNGDLLEDRLRTLAEEDLSSPVVLVMLFLSPGRHAGPGGDIAEICGSIETEYRGFRAYPSPLVGGHPMLVEILARRVAEIETTESEAAWPGAE